MVVQDVNVDTLSVSINLDKGVDLSNYLLAERVAQQCPLNLPGSYLQQRDTKSQQLPNRDLTMSNAPPPPTAAAPPAAAAAPHAAAVVHNERGAGDGPILAKSQYQATRSPQKSASHPMKRPMYVVHHSDTRVYVINLSDCIAIGLSEALWQ